MTCLLLLHPKSKELLQPPLLAFRISPFPAAARLSFLGPVVAKGLAAWEVVGYSFSFHMPYT